MILYAKSHEWVKWNDDNSALIGISDFAQNELGDLVFVNLPAVGDKIVAGEIFADVESVKAVSDIYSPISGIVAEVNEALLDNPALINENAAEAWFIRVDDVSAKADGLMTEDEYRTFTEA